MPPESLSQNLVELGNFAAHLAFAAAIIQGLAPLFARLLRRPALARISVNAAPVVFLLTTIGAATLIYSFLTDNFSVLYVADNSNRTLPLFYKIAALWGGHRGSLYLWVWILTFYTMVVAWHGRSRYPDRLPVILAVQGLVVTGFFGLILFLSSPFERLFPAAANGADLNPLLQHPGMVIHPPMLYFGYTGFSVPFAFAMAALLTRWRSELWTPLIRRWALIAWGFLTTGIILGGWWAYAVLGWGGYWGWDPVENASFMPWLLGTALIHSITVQERRRMLHTWNIFLVISTFALSLLGTFLVRSGILSSVHAFAVDPRQGTYILVFMIIALGLAFGTFMIKGRYQQAEESIASLWSRESLFVWNNVLFTVACLTVMLGTLYPLALEAFFGDRISIGPPYFDAVMMPILMLVLLLMGIGPLVPWRKGNLTRLRDRLALPVAVGLIVGAVMAVLSWPIYWTGPVAVALVAMVLTTIVTDLLRAVRQRRLQHPGEGAVHTLMRTVLGNRRHYGGMIVHLGVLLIAIGIVGSSLFRAETTVTMAPGDTVAVGGERLRFEGVTGVTGQNYQGVQAQVALLGTDRIIRPERRLYPNQGAPISEVDIDSRPLRDVYVVLAGRASDNRWVLRIYVNPLVQFLWIGGAVILSGLGLALSGKPRRVPQAAVAPSPDLVTAE